MPSVGMRGAASPHIRLPAGIPPGQPGCRSKAPAANRGILGADGHRSLCC